VAAGNEFLEAQGLAKEVCAQATRSSGVSCLPGSTNLLGSFPDAMVVGAINASGQKASYSSTGSVLWVSALGGEYGMQRNYLSSVGDAAKIEGIPDYMFSPAIPTTDRVGCGRGVKIAGDNYLDNRGKASRCLTPPKSIVSVFAAQSLNLNPSNALRSIAGIGATLAPLLIAVLGYAKRFRSEDHIRGFCGMFPTRNSSGRIDKSGQRLTKSGSDRVKRALYIAADVARKIDPDLAAVYWRLMVNKGQHHKQAICTVATRLINRIYRVLKTGEPYVFGTSTVRRLSFKKAKLSSR
jgi:hypothetical protein